MPIRAFITLNPKSLSAIIRFESRAAAATALATGMIDASESITKPPGAHFITIHPNDVPALEEPDEYYDSPDLTNPTPADCPSSPARSEFSHPSPAIVSSSPINSEVSYTSSAFLDGNDEDGDGLFEWHIAPEQTYADIDLKEFYRLPTPDSTNEDDEDEYAQSALLASLEPSNPSEPIVLSQSLSLSGPAVQNTSVTPPQLTNVQHQSPSTTQRLLLLLLKGLVDQTSCSKALQTILPIIA